MVSDCSHEEKMREIDEENQRMAGFLARPIATRKSDREFDSMLADDKKWKHPNWRLRHWMQRLFGILCGIIVSFVVLKILGCW